MGVEVDSSTDPFVKVFNGVAHILVFETTDEALALVNDGVRHYELCSTATRSGSSTCVSFSFNLVDLN